jgi:hypothetical protein
VDFVDCTGSEPLPPELPDLDGFEGADARRCTRSLLGIAHDRRLVVREKMTAGEDERNRRQVSIPRAIGARVGAARPKKRILVIAIT